MGILTDWLTDWLKEILIEGIMGNLTGLFGARFKQNLELDEFPCPECIIRLSNKSLVNSALADLKKRLNGVCLRSQCGAFFAG